MADKITSLKVASSAGTFGNEIPLGTVAANVDTLYKTETYESLQDILSDIGLGNRSVGNADKVNNHTVNIDVPSNAKFTDTTYGVVSTSSNGLMNKEDYKYLKSLSSAIDVTSDGTQAYVDNSASFKADKIQTHYVYNTSLPTAVSSSTTYKGELVISPLTRKINNVDTYYNQIVLNQEQTNGGNNFSTTINTDSFTIHSNLADIDSYTLTGTTHGEDPGSDIKHSFYGDVYANNNLCVQNTLSVTGGGEQDYGLNIVVSPVTEAGDMNQSHKTDIQYKGRTFLTLGNHTNNANMVKIADGVSLVTGNGTQIHNGRIELYASGTGHETNVFFSNYSYNLGTYATKSGSYGVYVNDNGDFCIYNNQNHTVVFRYDITNNRVYLLGKQIV